VTIFRQPQPPPSMREEIFRGAHLRYCLSRLRTRKNSFFRYRTIRETLIQSGRQFFWP
jgi:hypothetical protein